MELRHLYLKRLNLLLLIPVLIQAKEHGSNATKTNQILIANATKKSSDILVNTGLSLKQNRQSPSQLVGRGNRRIEVQRPLLEDGTDETREYEEEVSDSSPATDVLSEVAGRERNKEEILDAVRPYKSQDDDKFDIQDRRRQGAHILGKELNKMKNKGLLAESEDESIAEDAVFQEALAAHNKLRAMHHVTPLQWNATLAEQAQQTAESVSSDPSTFQGEPPGENIAQIWHDLPRAPLKATTIWYSEKKTFSFSYPELNDKVKHFTQMIWRDTTQLGMGAAPSPSGKYVIVVALYRPVGNDMHRIRDNVQRAGPVQDVYATIKEKITKPNN